MERQRVLLHHLQPSSSSSSSSHSLCLSLLGGRQCCIYIRGPLNMGMLLSLSRQKGLHFARQNVAASRIHTQTQLFIKYKDEIIPVNTKIVDPKTGDEKPIAALPYLLNRK